MRVRPTDGIAFSYTSDRERRDDTPAFSVPVLAECVEDLEAHPT